MKTLADIRSTFLHYFESQGHAVVDSSPLVPRNDPTLMFTNSGMVQFKNVFTGAEQRPYKRATTAQKSVRAGGKHNDLDNVGYTARHHTFFEMLGNFSFGDYFKPDAIEFAWTLVSKHFQLPKDKLLVTVYHEDDEAAALWKKIAGFSDDKIIRIKTNANFWRMADVGPCGPCSEIFIDQGDKLQGGPPGSPDEDGDRFLEFWNLVFMQYEELPGGKRINLPKPSVDTGMGLERIAAVMQGEVSNYDIDLFRAIIGTTAALVKIDPAGPQKASFRVIADHLRSSAFLIADGVLPSNEGRGYVLRRIMRRGMRHAHLLGAKEPLMFRLVSELVKLMGEAYPELKRAEPLVTETLKLEETRFKQTLDRGLKLLDEETAGLGKGQNLAGDVAFKLYDTYGFPLDLTQDILRGRGQGVDQAGFDTAMNKQKAEARKAWAGSGDTGTAQLWFDMKEELGATEFLGYSTESAEGVVTALIKNGAKVSEAKAGDDIAVLVNQTPFYAESGGQVGDTGQIKTANGATIQIHDTQKEVGALWVHQGCVLDGAVKLQDNVLMQVDSLRRARVRANHSATHLLHEALRRRLGEHVTQKGSLVTAERLRFDIAQPVPLTAEDIAAVEAEVNARIRVNEEVATRLMTPEAAMKTGAMALFGEKYGEEVRVVSMGGCDNHGAKEFSVELCGGTHVRRTGDIGIFKIIGESAVAAGVRRLEAVTGLGVLELVTTQEKWLADAGNILKAPAAELPTRITQILDERKKLEREVVELRRQLALAGGGGGASQENNGGKVVAGMNFISRILTDVPAKDLKPMADAFKQQVKSGIIVLVASFEGKASLVVAVTEDLTTRIDAVELVKAGAEAMGGKGGGGRRDMAQAGATDIAAMPAAVHEIEKRLAG
jgi:alanyl-tRNA synthetase